MASNKSFRFLAFSELRVGSAEWGEIQNAHDRFRREARPRHRLCRADTFPLSSAVIFSRCSLVESGQVEQFVACSALLQGLFFKLSERMVWSPVMVSVPGNHDLDRALSTGGGRLQVIGSIIRFCTIWRSALTEGHRSRHTSHGPANGPGPEAHLSTVPGDFFYLETAPVAGKGVGVIGLNTALNQVSAESAQLRSILKTPRLSTLLNGSFRKWSRG